ncbi:phosphatase PAP2 family protein [Rhodococcus sp. D2-41]|uniref:Phosphatase PAP2 family protein n=1 Tax=Speluncibacter jeojiensis TaxID=2710754 RepID=A0A9X4RFT8_9ACTN|nr:phosphatase PAP2 family protein [Rhodococcus sp. D2-41]MDG3012822.1 phosphatase PAP2 family protein [Rhodococcus sp. D2-41]MDG3017063.1 phosphatase PAP2 family protein [Corynebacteriales bacterium D3-21]
MPRIRAWIPLSSALFVLSVALGVTVTYSSLTTPRELRVDQGLQDLHESWLTAAMQAVSTVFSPPAGLVILAVATALLWWRRQRFAAVSTFLTVAVGWNSTLILKVFVDRPRPPFVHDATASYPSGHVALATSCAYAAYFLVRRHPRGDLRETVAVVGMFTVVLVMASRMYLGDHYLTDTIGAVLVSSSAVVCLCGLWPTLRGRLQRLPLFAGERRAEFEPRPAPARAAARATTRPARTETEPQERTHVAVGHTGHAPTTGLQEPEPAGRSERRSRAAGRRAETRSVPVPSHVGRHGSASRSGAPLSVQEIALRAGTSRHDTDARQAPAVPVGVDLHAPAAPAAEFAPAEPVAIAAGEYRPPLGRWVRYDLD